MKKLAVILLSAVLLTGCGSGAVDKAKPIGAESIIFEEHRVNSEYAILVDKETKVCYLRYKHASGYAGSGGLTVMLNADGTPKLWEE